MLVSNTLRFATDIFGLPKEEEEEEEQDTGEEDPPEETEIISTPTKVKTPSPKRALLVSKATINCANKTEVTKIIVSGSQPEKSKRGFMWQIGDKVYKFNPTTLALEEFTDDVTAENVLKYGNRAALLNGLTNITAFVGKKLKPIIALQAAADAAEFPTAKVQVLAKTTSETLIDEQETPVYELANSTAVPRIVSMTAETTTTGAGSVDIKVRLRNADETWTDWLTLKNAADKDAAACQFKFTYQVTTTDGSDSAQVDEIVVEHTLGRTVVSGDDAELYSTVVDYIVPLQLCYVTVRHSELIDSKILAYVNFMRPPSRRELIQIGVGNGQRQELVLGVGGVPDLNIDVSSVEIRADGELMSDFDANSASGTVVLSAKKNAVLHASYDYNHAMESWKKMTLETTQPYTDDAESFVSRYSYMLSDSDASSDKTISNIKLVLQRPTGKVTGYSLGKATGRKQLFALPHIPKKSTIKFPNAANPVEFNYDEETEILAVTAKKKTDLVMNYSWVGEEVTVYGFSAGWSIA